MAERTLDVQVYYDFLGTIAGDGSKMSFKEPGPCTFDLTEHDVYRLRFVINSDTHKKRMDDALENVQGQIDNRVEMKNTVTIVFKQHLDGKLHHVAERKWKDDVVKTLRNVLETYIVDVKVIEKELWDTIVDKLHSKDKTGGDSSSYFTVTEARSIVIVRMAEEFAIVRNIEELLEKEHAALVKKDCEITETFSLNQKYKAQFIFENKFQEKQIGEGLIIHVDVNAATVTIIGSRTDVMDCKMLMFKGVGNLASKNADLPRMCRMILMYDESTANLLTKIRKTNLIGVWNIHDGDTDQCNVTVFSDTYENVLKVEEIINSSLKLHTFSVQDDAKPILASDKWQAVKDSIVSENHGLVLIENNVEYITVASIVDIFQDIVDQIKAFLVAKHEKSKGMYKQNSN